MTSPKRAAQRNAEHLRDAAGAVANGMEARSGNAGQACLAAKRFILEAPIAEAFTAMLGAADIVPNIHHAHRRPERRAARCAGFQTWPSATADLGGVLIHDAQGVRPFAVLPLARR